MLLPLLAACADQHVSGPAASAGPVQPVYCYRSLADIDCYLTEDRERPAQLVGVWYRPIPTVPDAPIVLR